MSSQETLTGEPDGLSPAELERLERLAEQTSEAEPWVPKERGDSISGKVLGWQTGHKRGDASVQCAVLVLRSAEGDRAVYTWHAQARYKLIAPKEALGDDRSGETVPPASRLARTGDFVAIAYRGMSPIGDSDVEAASYAVAIDRTGSSGDEDPRRPSPEAMVPSTEEQEDASRQEQRPSFEDDDDAPF